MGVIVQTIVFEALNIYLGIRPSVSILMAVEFGILTGFTLNNRYSFGDRPRAPLPLRLLRFHVVVSGSILIQWICVYTAEMLGAGFIALNAAYAAGILLGFTSNYTGYRLWVWKHHS